MFLHLTSVKVQGNNFNDTLTGVLDSSMMNGISKYYE